MGRIDRCHRPSSTRCPRISFRSGVERPSGTRQAVGVWLSVRDYANALLLRPRALRKWGHPAPGSTPARSRYGRARLHPSARPQPSTRTSDRTKEPPVESLLTTAPEVEAAPPAARPRRNFTALRSTPSCSKPTAIMESPRAYCSGVRHAWFQQGQERQPRRPCGSPKSETSVMPRRSGAAECPADL
jgi:hypothetical protein